MDEDDWRGMSCAPKGAPVRVWANYDPSDHRMSWREFIAEDAHGLGYWKTLGRRGLRVYPTYWRPLPAPPSPAAQ